MALAALAIMLALVAPPADAADRVAALPPPATSGAPADDYYTRRAKNIIQAEKAVETKPHPLAVPYRGMDVVVCEAGCRESAKPEIVYLRRYAIAAPAARADAPMNTSAIAKGPPCLGGCYSNVANLIVPPAPEPAPVSPSAYIGEWPTKVSKPIERDKLSPIR